ncbi:MAG: hypothetical protein JNK98_05960 [Chitinophagaceae bacterium]|nr:hypothetical protein [Chitinophagaceae bacterium]
MPYTFTTMKLMMYIDNDLIDTATLEDERIPIPGYLGEFKRQMKQKHRELILQASKPPEFLVTITKTTTAGSETIRN